MSSTRLFVLSAAMLGIAAFFVPQYSQNNAKSAAAALTAENRSDPTAEPIVAAASMNNPTQSSKEFSLETSSLRATAVDGGVIIDANGQVLLDLGMRRLFDYYLSLVGERDVVQIRVLLKDYLSGRYNLANTETVLKYFDRYTDYLNQLGDLKIGGLASPDDRLQKVTALRKKMLGEEMALAFFADEELLAALTLKRMAIANDKKLTGEQKAKLLAELDASANYSSRTEADTAALIAEQNKQLDALKFTDAQRNAEREALWGKDAANRLSLLDQQRSQWDKRVDAYLLARSRIDANRGLSAQARTHAIAAIRAQQFDAAEQRRIASLEAIGQLKPGG